nr:hypothetical protein [Rhodococcus sp. (in: high G+C Gram-positive bacteria)]
MPYVGPGDFEYYNVGTSRYPKNPAIARILVSQDMRALMMSYGQLGQEIFAGQARRAQVSSRRQNRRHRPNADSTRLKAYKGGVQLGPGPRETKPDRWIVAMENYAQHSLKEEFGRVDHDSSGVRYRGPNWHKQNYVDDGHRPVATVRDRAQHVLNGRARQGLGVIQILEGSANKKAKF